MDFLLDLLQGIGVAAAVGIRPFLPVLLVAGATQAGVLFYGFESCLLGQFPGGLLFLLRTAALSALYNALLTPLLYPILRRVTEASRTSKVYRW